jgi:hypothetical protein
MSELSDYKRLVERPAMAAKDETIRRLRAEVDRLQAALASAPPGWDADAIRAQAMLDCVSWIDDLYRAAPDEVSKDAYREASGVILAVYGETAPQPAAASTSRDVVRICHPTDPHCNWPECRCQSTASVSAPPVAEGWVCVPREPTKEMLHAHIKTLARYCEGTVFFSRDVQIEAYRAMIASAAGGTGE